MALTICRSVFREGIGMGMFKTRTRDRSFLLSVIITTAKLLFFVVLLLGITGTGFVIGIAKAWVETAPPLDLGAFERSAKTSYIYDKHGSLVTELRGSENRVNVDISEVPRDLVNAVIAIEDQRYLTHNGVDVRRIFGALVTNLFNSKSQGGSTITQQLIKQTMLGTEQNYKRKLQEAYLALELEKRLSKQDILVEYLNVIYLGGNNYGVKVAAKDYFGKELHQLTLRESACLARIIRNPGRYNPRRAYYSPTETSNYADLNMMTNYVLDEMYDQGLITEAEHQLALAEEMMVLQEPQFKQTMYEHAYYVEYAIYDVVTKMLHKESLADNSTNRSSMESKLYTGGYRIYTSLDPQMQQSIQDVITNWGNYPAMRNSTQQTYKASLGGDKYLSVRQPQAAAAIMNWRSGELLAIVGGRSEPIQRKQLNRANPPASFSGMPVGSTIKPLAVYGPAFDLGYSPNTPVINAPLRIESWDDGSGGKGYPNNFGGNASTFTGMVRMRVAINKSLNTSCAQALINYVGVENSVMYLRNLGIRPEHISSTPAGLALGLSGLSVIELAGAFGAIANNGMYLEPYAFTKVVDSNDNMVIDQQVLQIRRQVFKPSTAWMLVSVLRGCVHPDSGTGGRAHFGDYDIAGKTGTNSDSCGVTFAGITPYLSGAVWIGHDDYKPLISSATGGNYAAPLWAAVMSKAHSQLGYNKKRKILSATAADVGLILAEACAVSGMKPTSACGKDVNNYGVTRDYYLKGTEPSRPCDMHRTVTLCTKSKKAPGQYCKSKAVYGAIYLPEGHPLRYADIKTVREWFKGASTDKSSAQMEVCKTCKSATGKTATKSTAERKLTEAINNAQTQVDRANLLLNGGALSEAQAKQLSALRDDVLRAIESQSVSNMNKYGKQLMKLVNKHV